MVVWLFLLLLLLPGLVISAIAVYMLYDSVRCLLKRRRLKNLPPIVENGYIEIDKTKHSSHLMDSYTVDSHGNTYTHIGGGGQISILESYSLKFWPGSEHRLSSNPLILYSLPGGKQPMPLPFRCGTVTYVMDSDGTYYFVHFEREEKEEHKNDRI